MYEWNSNTASHKHRKHSHVMVKLPDLGSIPAQISKFLKKIILVEFV